MSYGETTVCPYIELDVSDGNPLDFHYFMTLIHEVVKKRTDNSKERLSRLLKYTSDDKIQKR